MILGMRLLWISFIYPLSMMIQANASADLQNGIFPFDNHEY